MRDFQRSAVALVIVLVALTVSAPAFASYGARVAGGTLTLTGNRTSDKLVLRLKKGAPGRLQVDVGANGITDFEFARSRFTKIVVNAGAGNDTIAIVEKNGVFTKTETTTLSGGPGSDKITGGSGGETFTGGPGLDTLLGKNGDDVFTWRSGESSDKIDGQSGSDSLTLEGAATGESFDLSANASRLKMQHGAHVLSVGTVEFVAANPRGGADNVVIEDLTGTGVGQVALDLGVGAAGDGAADAVVVNGTNAVDLMSVSGGGGSVTLSAPSLVLAITHAEPTNDTLTINTLGGDDLFSASSLASTSVLLTINGGDGDDILVGSQGNDTMNGGAGDDRIFGGDGNDTLDGGTGTDQIDGGAGIDTATNGETVTNVP